MDFSGKRILITGASRGIGKACARAFAARGAQVAINYHRDNICSTKTEYPHYTTILFNQNEFHFPMIGKLLKAIDTLKPQTSLLCLLNHHNKNDEKIYAIRFSITVYAYQQIFCNIDSNCRELL